ncbi:exported hypothetical protein [Candidatus Sulfopaludibacter sp. SbA3]|nr:exported hypothetical protein [Candidatus Sulfopaludibacter sp. SbA3]
MGLVGALRRRSAMLTLKVLTAVLARCLLAGGRSIDAIAARASAALGRR